MAIEQFARQLQGPHGIISRIAAGSIWQDGETVGRQHVEQIGLRRVLADVGTSNGDGDDFGSSGLGGQTGFLKILELARSGQQP